MAEPLEFEIRLRKNEADIQKLADSFSSRIEKGLRDAVNKLGLGKFGPVSTSEGGGKGGISGNLSNATKMGVVAGLAAGGIVTLLGMIAEALKGMPIIVGIMKMFNLIMAILLLPLIPVLKPALLAMANFAKDLKKLLFPDTPEAEKSAGLGALIGAVLGTALGGPGIGTLIGGIIGAAIGTIIGKEGKEALVGYIIEGLGKVFGVVVEKVVPYIFDNIIGPGVAGIITILGDLFRIGAVEPTKKIFESIGKVFNDIDTLLGSPLKTIGNTLAGIRDNLQPLLDKIMEWLAKFGLTPSPTSGGGGGGAGDGGGGGGGGGTTGTPITWTTNPIGTVSPGTPAASGESYWSNYGGGQYTIPGNNPAGSLLSDFIKTPQGVFKTSPDDFLIGMKNPSKLGGSNITINVDRPTVRNESDIKALVREISLELYKAQRRYVSYA